MKDSLRVLNSRETKALIKEIEAHFGNSPDLKDYALYQNNEYRVFLLSKERIKDIDMTKLRVNNAGLYFGTIEKGGFRPSIEGAQLIKPKKNFVEIDKGLATLWTAGHDLEIKAEGEGITIIKLGNDILGCGRHKEGKVLNLIPKDRRIKDRL